MSQLKILEINAFIGNEHALTINGIEELDQLILGKQVHNIDELKPKLNNITIAPENTNYLIENGILYSRGYQQLKKCSAMVDNIVLKEETGYLENYCFSGTGLTSLIIPESVYSIRENTFNNIKNLKNLEIYSNAVNSYNNYNAGLKLMLDGVDELDNLVVGKQVMCLMGIKSKIKNFNVDKDNEYNLLDNNILYSKNHNTLIKCSSLLDSVTINENTKMLENYCFTGTKISSLKIPKNVTEINDDAFYEVNIKELEIQEDYSYYGENLSDTLEKLIVNNSTIENFMNVYKLNNLKEIIFKEGSIGFAGSIYDCDKLEKISIPASFEVFYPETFNNNKNLQEINVNINNPIYQSVDGIVYQGNKLVHYPAGKSNSKVEISNDIKGIGDNAFEYCENIEQVVLPEDLDYIGKSAFRNCKNLKQINIPKNIISLNEAFHDNELNQYIRDDFVFENCNSLEIITINPENQSYTIDNNCLYTKDYSILIKYLDNDATSFIAHENTKCIGFEAFLNKSNLKNINLNNVTDIVYFSFVNCTALENLEFPNVINYEDGLNFLGCTSLKSITIPDKIEKFNFTDKYSNPIFNGCSSLTTIDLNNLKEFDSVQLYGCCDNLKEIIIPKTVQKINISEFDNITYYVYADSAALQYFEAFSNDYNNYKYKIINEINESATNIKVDTGTSNNIDQDAKLVVNEITEGDVYNKVIQALKNFNIYDISFKKGEQTIDVDGYCIVSVPVQNDMDKDKCKIYYLDDNGNYEDMKAKYQDGFMVFRTNHFSNYILTDSELSKQILGDVNNDGIINYSDAVLVLQNDTGAGNLTAEQLKAANVNGDNVVDYNDAVQILKYDAGNITEFK